MLLQANILYIKSSFLYGGIETRSEQNEIPTDCLTLDGLPLACVIVAL